MEFRFRTGTYEKIGLDFDQLVDDIVKIDERKLTSFELGLLRSAQNEKVIIRR